MLTSILKTLFDNVVLPSMLTLASAEFPLLGVALQIPLIGDGIRRLIQWWMDTLISNGIIDLKDTLIDKLSATAKAEYSTEITILRSLQAEPSLTPEQEAEYVEKLQAAVKNHVSVVNL